LHNRHLCVDLGGSFLAKLNILLRREQVKSWLELSRPLAKGRY
jgi:hypothetical protein